MTENQVEREKALSQSESNDGYPGGLENGQAKEESHYNMQNDSRREQMQLEEEELTKLAVVLADKQAKVQGMQENLRDAQNDTRMALDRVRTKIRELNTQGLDPAETISRKESRGEIREVIRGISGGVTEGIIPNNESSQLTFTDIPNNDEEPEKKEKKRKRKEKRKEKDESIQSPTKKGLGISDMRQIMIPLVPGQEIPWVTLMEKLANQGIPGEEALALQAFIPQLTEHGEAARQATSLLVEVAEMPHKKGEVLETFFNWIRNKYQLSPRQKRAIFARKLREMRWNWRSNPADKISTIITEVQLTWDKVIREQLLCEDLEAALASKLEMSLQLKITQQPPHKWKQAITDIWESVRDITEITESEEEKQVSTQNNSERDNKKAPLKCFYCHEAGHFKRECPKRPPPQWNRGRGGWNRGRGVWNLGRGGWIPFRDDRYRSKGGSRGNSGFGNTGPGMIRGRGSNQVRGSRSQDQFDEPDQHTYSQYHESQLNERDMVGAFAHTGGPEYRNGKENERISYNPLR